MPRLTRLLACASVACLLPRAALADSPPLVRDLFGSGGLIDMPSARMAPDGEISANASYFSNNQRYSLGFQALPWLETSFRYAGLSHEDPQFSVYYDRSFAAKVRLWQEGEFVPAVAVGINDLVGTGIYGSEYIVASKRFGDFDATLGMGWGRLAEAATIRNPLTLASSSFDSRTLNVGNGGSLDFHTFFHGAKAGIFGGINWLTPIKGLSLVAEYSSDSYSLEASRGNFAPREQLNLGASYQIADRVTLGLGWLYGESATGSISFQLDPTSDPTPQKIGPELPPVQMRTDEQQQQALQVMLGRRGTSAKARPDLRGALVDALWNAEPRLGEVALQGRKLHVAVPRTSHSLCENMAKLVTPYANSIDTIVIATGKLQVSCTVAASYIPRLQFASDDAALTTHLTPQLVTIDATAPVAKTPAQAAVDLRRDAARQGIRIEALSFGRSDAVVYYTNERYFAEAEGVDRLLRLLMEHAPPDVEKFRLIAVATGVPQSEFDIMRATAERSFTQNGNYDLFRDGGIPVPPPMDNPVLIAQEKHTYPRFTWSIFPQVRQEFFDPANPVGVQFLAGARATLEMVPGLVLTGEADASLYDTFYTSRPSNSVLPHVRTDFLQYFDKGRDGISNLEANYSFRLAPNVFARARAGYVETMFAAVGGEFLWRPEGQRWALGADMYEVQQRAFNMLFGLQPYRQMTGHVSLYYQSPWYNLDFQLRAGQYLAGDRGLTLQVSRRFTTGVEVGVFATKTNVSAAQFGEGSFDKGIFIRIPVDWALPIHTQQQLALQLRPVQRDGGQFLGGDAVLYEQLRTTGEAEMRNIAGDD